MSFSSIHFFCEKCNVFFEFFLKIDYIKMNIKSKNNEHDNRTIIAKGKRN